MSAYPAGTAGLALLLAGCLAATAFAAPVIETLPTRANGDAGTALSPGAVPLGAQYIAPSAAGPTPTPASVHAAAAERAARGAQFIPPALQAAARPAAEPGPSVAAAPAERSRQLAQQLAQVDGRSGARSSGVVTLPDVLFDSNGSRLRSGAERSIEPLVEVMRRFPERRVLLEGFTDNVGAQTFNYDLSQRRAESVRAALLAAGADARRIDISAQGPAGPVASNATSSGRAQNRRVEVIFSDESGRFPSR